MKRPAGAYVFFVLTGLLILSFAYSVDNAYGHGVASGIGSLSVRIEGEQISEQRSSTEGGVLTITGTLVSLTTERIEMSPRIAVTPSGFVDSEVLHSSIPPYYDLLYSIYPPYRDQSGWYFRAEHSLLGPFVLEPGERVDYQIRIYPLKAGIYHVHSFFEAEDFDRIGRGQTVVVTGSSAPTYGEATQLYLPLIFGAASFAVLIWTITRKKRSKRERLTRLYFAAKSSFETVWLAGIMLWLIIWASYLYTLEERLTYALLSSAALAAIVALGYASVMTRSKLGLYALAAGTSAATAVVYFALLSVREPQLDMDGFVSFVIVIGNSVVAAFFAIIAYKARRGSAKITSLHS